QNGVLLPDDQITESMRNRRAFPKTASSRQRPYKVKKSSRFPSTSKQLQIHLYRLPAYILKTGSQSLPWPMPQFVDQSQRLTQLPISQPSCNVTNSPPELLQLEMYPASVLPSPPIAHSPQKSPLLRLPPPAAQPASGLRDPTPQSTQQQPTSASCSAVAEVLPQKCDQGCEPQVKHPDSLMDVCSANADKTVGKAFPNPSWTFSPGKKLQKQQEQEDAHGLQHEEDKATPSVKETELQSCPTTDPQYVLRSQNPPECASVNTLTGLTNGFLQKGVLQLKHKIRVDFKEFFLTMMFCIWQMIFCQICCEPFHDFCLTPDERPKEDSKENWCCRRCKFCHVCGRRSKKAKVCMTCIRCKSCGVTPGKTWDMAWNQEHDLLAFICTACRQSHTEQGSLKEVLQSKLLAGLKEVLTDLLSSSTTQHLLLCKEVMKQAFSWFSVSHLKKWSSFSEELPSGMLPEAVLPPSKEHSYAQWMERAFHTREFKGLETQTGSTLSSVAAQEARAKIRSASHKSHHILTLRDLDDTRRPRRLSSRSRRSTSPTETNPSLTMSLRLGGSVGSRCALLSSPPRSTTLGSTSPPLSRQNSTSPVWNSPSRSGSSISGGFSPRQGGVTHSPRGTQNFKITTPVTAEVPQDFLASSEAEEAAVATTNGISLAPDNLEEDIAHLMSQELPYTVFDADVAVASMLSTKLEFDEALLAENVALGSGRVEGMMQDMEIREDNQENSSEDEDSGHYSKISRTVVCNTASDSDASSIPAPAQSISQLDGADSGSETEESEDKAKVIAVQGTPTKHLTVALQRLESIFTLPKSNTEKQMSKPEHLESSSSPVFLESNSMSNELSLQEEEVPLATDSPTSQTELFLDPAMGHFVSAKDGCTVNSNQGAAPDKDETSSNDSTDVFQDDLNDPDFSPQSESKRSPSIMQKRTIVIKRKLSAPSLSKPLLPKHCLQLKPNITLIAPNVGHSVCISSVSPSPAAFSAVPQPASSPFFINGLNALPIQPGATRGRPIAIRLDNSKPESSQQAEGNQNQSEAANSPGPQTPVRQVLLVNRQGQILVKDLKSNTFQTLPGNSPAYSKISQIAKFLHRGNSLNQSVPQIMLKPQPSSSDLNISPPTNHVTPERKVIVKVMPVKPVIAPASLVPVSMQTFSPASFSQMEERTTQAIINRAMATEMETPRPVPIILKNTCRRKARQRQPTQLTDTEDSDQSSVGRSESPSSFQNEPTHPLVRVKRVSSLSERASKKKSKIDFLKNPSMAWRAVVDGVLDARADFHLKQLPLGVMSAQRVLGVVHDAVIYLLEQLEGAASCKRHRFRFHRCDDAEEELPLNPSGCARAEVYTRCRHAALHV
ncbi:hypothetical protein XENOCAPTIV_029384, partial [Xenoophorus captivus]